MNEEPQTTASPPRDARPETAANNAAQSTEQGTARPTGQPAEDGAAPSAGQPAEDLRVEGLKVTRGGRAVLHGVDLAVPRGKVTALLGANGAGKSSLVLTVAGLLRPTAGTVVAGGDDLTGLRPERVRAAGVAAVPEGHRVLADLSVADNLRVAGAGLPKREVPAAVAAAVEVFPELHDLTDRPAGTLSGGQQQMLALAQALVARPRYLLVDELSLGLAPVVVARLVPVLADLAARGIGVLLIEQFMGVALKLAERVYVLDRGRITYEGTSQQLRDSPDLLHTAYLGAASNSNA
ncbi:ABC transporter ATP-binding protein [Sphaerisporangium siamense]|nr:ABC transporter ATP-binding protein [Sphaerisporangium siamense]